MSRLPGYLIDATDTQSHFRLAGSWRAGGPAKLIVYMEALGFKTCGVPYRHNKDPIRLLTFWKFAGGPRRTYRFYNVRRKFRLSGYSLHYKFVGPSLYTLGIWRLAPALRQSAWGFIASIREPDTFRFRACFRYKK